MTTRVAPVALRRVVRPGLPLACLAEGVVGDGMNGSGRGLDVALVFELIGGALAGRDIAALADIDRLVDGAALPVGVEIFLMPSSALEILCRVADYAE